MLMISNIVNGCMGADYFAFQLGTLVKKHVLGFSTTGPANANTAIVGVAPRGFTSSFINLTSTSSYSSNQSANRSIIINNNVMAMVMVMVMVYEIITNVANEGSCDGYTFSMISLPSPNTPVVDKHRSFHLSIYCF
jgi:hypothetical protein